MPKKVQDIQNKNLSTTLELTVEEAGKFDSDIAKKLEVDKSPKEVKIKAFSKELLRKGPYVVIDRGTPVYVFKTRREAYDKALEINANRGFGTRIVEELFG